METNQYEGYRDSAIELMEALMIQGSDISYQRSRNSLTVSVPSGEYKGCYCFISSIEGDVPTLHRFIENVLRPSIFVDGKLSESTIRGNAA